MAATGNALVCTLNSFLHLTQSILSGHNFPLVLFTINAKGFNSSLFILTVNGSHVSNSYINTLSLPPGVC